MSSHLFQQLHLQQNLYRSNTHSTLNTNTSTSILPAVVASTSGNASVKSNGLESNLMQNPMSPSRFFAFQSEDKANMKSRIRQSLDELNPSRKSTSEQQQHHHAIIKRVPSFSRKPSAASLVTSTPASAHRSNVNFNSNNNVLEGITMDDFNRTPVVAATPSTPYSSNINTNQNGQMPNNNSNYPNNSQLYLFNRKTHRKSQSSSTLAFNQMQNSQSTSSTINNNNNNNSSPSRENSSPSQLSGQLTQQTPTLSSKHHGNSRTLHLQNRSAQQSQYLSQSAASSPAKKSAQNPYNQQSITAQAMSQYFASAQTNTPNANNHSHFSPISSSSNRASEVEIENSPDLSNTQAYFAQIPKHDRPLKLQPSKSQIIQPPHSSSQQSSSPSSTPSQTASSPLSQPFQIQIPTKSDFNTPAATSKAEKGNQPGRRYVLPSANFYASLNSQNVKFDIKKALQLKSGVTSTAATATTTKISGYYEENNNNNNQSIAATTSTKGTLLSGVSQRESSSQNQASQNKIDLPLASAIRKSQQNQQLQQQQQQQSESKPSQQTPQLLSYITQQKRSDEPYPLLSANVQSGHDQSIKKQDPRQTPLIPNTPNQQQQQQQQLLRKSKINHPESAYYLKAIQRALRQPQPTDTFSQLAREHFTQTCQGIVFSNHARAANPNDLAQKRVNLGPRNPKYKKTLVFDLDETLIHCNANIMLPSDFIVDLNFPTGERIQAGINVRPFAEEILRELSKEFEIIVFTASHSCYAQAVIDRIDPERVNVHHRFFREHCIQSPQGVYMKDLRVFGDRNLSEIVLIDNAAYSFCFQVDNGIPIIPFYDSKTDQELKHLVSYVQHMNQTASDVREYNRQHLKMFLFNDPQGPLKVAQNLFKKI